MKKASILLFGLFVFLTTFQTAQAQKDRYQSLFIYNFTKYVKWPDNNTSDKFVIGVVGNASITQELLDMAAKRIVNGSNIVVQQFKSASEITDCHILYVSEKESGNMQQILNVTANKSVLIVSDKPGLASKGAVINFIEKDGKIKFELNQANADQRRLKISGSLTSLAVLV